MKDKKQILKEILQNDPHGLLKIEPKKSAARTSDERLASSFDEINEFIEKNEREPKPDPTNISEYTLYATLKGLRENEQKIEALKPQDKFDLLKFEKKEYNSINDIYAIIARGGSFFSHNKPRIQAYAEWDIYNHLVVKRAVPISEIDFELEKEAFIERNHKILESSNSFVYWDSFTEEGRKATLQELQALFESLSEKIDTPFYLSCVVEFEERYQHLISVQS